MPPTLSESQKLDRGAEWEHRRYGSRRHSGLAVTNLDLGVDDGVGVDLMDADGGVGLSSLDNAVVYRKGCNAGGDVAAVGLVVDLWLDEADLTEGIIDVRIFSAGRADYRKLAGEDVRTAETVYLTDIGVAEYLKNILVAQFGITGRSFP